MDTISLKLPSELNQALEIQARQRGLRKSQLMRVILETYIEQNRPPSADSLLDSIHDLAGVLDGPADLAHNPAYMDGYGEKL